MRRKRIALAVALLLLGGGVAFADPARAGVESCFV